MMPKCDFDGCRKTADVRLLELDYGRKDGYGRPWPMHIYTCKKHAKEVCKMFGREWENENG